MRTRANVAQNSAGSARIEYMPALALAIVVLLTGSQWMPSLLRQVWPAAFDRMTAWPEAERVMAYDAAALGLVAVLLAGINALSIWLHRRKQLRPPGSEPRRPL